MTHKQFLYGDTKVLIRGLRDIAEMCGMNESGGGNATPPPPNEFGLMSGRSKPD